MVTFTPLRLPPLLEINSTYFILTYKCFQVLSSAQKGKTSTDDLNVKWQLDFEGEQPHFPHLLSLGLPLKVLNFQ